MQESAPKPQPLAPINPQLDVIKQQAETDNVNALQKRVGAETEDLLRKYGGRVALSGANIGAPPLSLAG